MLRQRKPYAMSSPVVTAKTERKLDFPRLRTFFERLIAGQGSSEALLSMEVCRSHRFHRRNRSQSGIKFIATVTITQVCEMRREPLSDNGDEIYHDLPKRFDMARRRALKLKIEGRFGLMRRAAKLIVFTPVKGKCNRRWPSWDRRLWMRTGDWVNPG